MHIAQRALHVWAELEAGTIDDSKASNTDDLAELVHCTIAEVSDTTNWPQSDVELLVRYRAHYADYM